MDRRAFLSGSLTWLRTASRPTRRAYQSGLSHFEGWGGRIPISGSKPAPSSALSTGTAVSLPERLSAEAVSPNGLLGGVGDLGGVGSGFSGFAEGGLITGDGSGTSDSNLIMASDGEFIVNADATGRNRALLEAINAGKAPRFATGPSSASFASSLVHAPTVNITMNGDADREAATKIAGAVGKALDASKPDSFRKSHGQLLAEANAHLQRAALRHG